MPAHEAAADCGERESSGKPGAGHASCERVLVADMGHAAASPREYARRPGRFRGYIDAGHGLATRGGFMSRSSFESKRGSVREPSRGGLGASARAEYRRSIPARGQDSDRLSNVSAVERLRERSIDTSLTRGPSRVSRRVHANVHTLPPTPMRCRISPRITT